MRRTWLVPILISLSFASTAWSQPLDPPPSDPPDPDTDRGTEPGEPEALPEAPQAQPAPPVVAPAPPQPMVPWHPGSSAPIAAYEPPPAEESGPSRDMSRDFWQVHAGVRTTWIGNEAYNVFDENDGFSQLSIGGSRAFVLSDQLSFAPGLLWEFGALESEARGARSELLVHRIGGVAEGRFHIGRDLYALAKLVPHAVHTRAYLHEASSPETLQQRTWSFGLDATAGAAWNAPRSLGAPDVVPQFWLVGELGYGWTLSKDLELKPDVDEDDPRARMNLNLGPMDLRGIMMRVNVAMTF